MSEQPARASSGKNTGLIRSCIVLQGGTWRFSKVIDQAQAFRTVTGVALGTPHSIALEQASGDKGIDGRTDDSLLKSLAEGYRVKLRVKPVSRPLRRAASGGGRAGG